MSIATALLAFLETTIGKWIAGDLRCHCRKPWHVQNGRVVPLSENAAAELIGSIFRVNRKLPVPVRWGRAFHVALHVTWSSRASVEIVGNQGKPVATPCNIKSMV